MANPSEEPLVDQSCDNTPPYPHIADLEDQVSTLLNLTERQRVLLSNAEATNAELMLENANLRLTIEDQSEEIANCKILKYEAVLDDMEEFCTVRPDIDGDDPVVCGWRDAIYRMREIRRG